MSPIKTSDIPSLRGEKKDDFIELLWKSHAIEVDNFITKSGRHSPYFINTAAFCDGKLLSYLCDFYAAFVKEYFPGVTCLYGPAYKGIPLCVGVSMLLGKDGDRSVAYSFDRKEMKAHGEATHSMHASSLSEERFYGKEKFVGKVPRKNDKVVVLDDVITSGSSLIASVELLCKQKVDIMGVMVAVDRQEKGIDKPSAKQWFFENKIPFCSLVTVRMIFTDRFMKQFVIDDTDQKRILKYLYQYSSF